MLALAGAPTACTPDKLGSEGGGPPGSGGFDPGGGLPTGNSTSGSGNTGGSSTGGTGGAPEPVCANDDSSKRCGHVFTYQDQGESSVEVRGDWAADSWDKGVMLTKSNGVWSATVDLPWTGNTQYKYVLNGATWITDPGNPDTITDGSGNTNSVAKGEMCDPYTCAAPVTLGYDWRDAIIYFVFVDRFFDGNASNNGSPTGAETAAEYKGGDWAGVTQKIESGYFTDLGVNALWVTVPMQNPNNKELGDDGRYYSAYHGYWPSDLEKTEEHFGSMADLKALVDAAHAKGIKVLIDYAMNHVHSSSPVYQAHKNDGWFNPNSNGNGGNCVCGQGCDWNNQAEVCWFTDYLPDFNFDNADARKFSVDNAIWWINQTGIDGFRLDAVKHIKTSWITDLRSRVTAEVEPVSGNHFYMVGETFTGDIPTIAKFVNPSTKLDGQFDFPLRVALAETVLMRKAPMSNLDGALTSSANSYGFGVMSTFIGNHDMPRAINFAQDSPAWSNVWDGGKDKNYSNQPGQPGEKSAYERLAAAYAVLFTTKGAPLVYYGDEYGLAGAGDPDNRRMMQWSGYSANQTFLNGQLKKLTKIRADHTALRRGGRTTIGVTNDTLAYKMSDADETVYVVINRGDSQQSVGGLPGSQMTDLMSGAAVSGPNVNVPARSALILK